MSDFDFKRESISLTCPMIDQMHTIAQIAERMRRDIRLSNDSTLSCSMSAYIYCLRTILAGMVTHGLAKDVEMVEVEAQCPDEKIHYRISFTGFGVGAVVIDI